MKTQTEKVLEYMKQNGGITAMAAFNDLGITRLSARIYDLRKAGYTVNSRRVSYLSNGDPKHYDVFSLGVEE